LNSSVLKLSFCITLYTTTSVSFSIYYPTYICNNKCSLSKNGLSLIAVPIFTSNFLHSEKRLLESHLDAMFLIKMPIFTNYSCFIYIHMNMHEFGFIIYYCKSYVKVLYTELDCYFPLLQTSSSNSASHQTISHIYTDVQLLPLKCAINAETGHWTKWNISHCIYILSLLSFFSVHTTHLLLACFFVTVGGLRSGKCLPENLPVGSGGNDVTGVPDPVRWHRCLTQLGWVSWHRLLPS
jgi:hypothetical protein